MKILKASLKLTHNGTRLNINERKVRAEAGKGGDRENEADERRGCGSSKEWVRDQEGWEIRSEGQGGREREAEKKRGKRNRKGITRGRKGRGKVRVNKKKVK